MADDDTSPPKSGAKSEREARLNAALRANLQKRKQQSRKRTQGGAADESVADSESHTGSDKG